MINRNFVGAFFGACLLALSLSADAARVKAFEDAYELPAKQILSVSDKDKGNLEFKTCPNCPVMRVPMSAATTFEINGRQVSKQAFWSAVRRSKGYVYLFVEIEANRVSRIKLDG